MSKTLILAFEENSAASLNFTFFGFLAYCDCDTGPPSPSPYGPNGHLSSMRLLWGTIDLVDSQTRKRWQVASKIEDI